MTQDTTTKKTGLKPLEIAAGAGAAVITAFASSFLGTAGTLTGAAVASVIGTVSTTLLRTSADRSAEKLRVATARLRDTRASALGHPGEDIDPYGTQLFGAPGLADPAAAGSGPDGLDSAGTPTSPAPPDLGAAPLGTAGSAPGVARRPVAVRVRPGWLVLAAGAVIAFVAALAVITGIETAAGEPLAGLVGKDTGGGSTIGRTIGAGGSSPKRDTTPTPTPTATPTATGTDAGTTASAPAEPTPSGAATPTTAAPTGAATTGAPPATTSAPAAPTATTSPEPLTSPTP
jgi:hypothetical protein